MTQSPGKFLFKLFALGLTTAVSYYLAIKLDEKLQEYEKEYDKDTKTEKQFSFKEESETNKTNNNDIVEKQEVKPVKKVAKKRVVTKKQSSKINKEIKKTEVDKKVKTPKNNKKEDNI